MAITITHAKTNNIPAWTQTDLDAAIATGQFAPGTTIADITLSTDWNTAHATSMATNRLLGRGTAGTGSFEEITLGTNLSFAGTTLNASGGGATVFTALTDVPASYSSQANKFVRVKATEDGLEFTTSSGSSLTIGDAIASGSPGLVLYEDGSGNLAQGSSFGYDGTTVTIGFVDINGGNIDAAVIGGSTPAAITGTTITANTNFAGNLTGNVTGNVSGSSGSTTGNAATATALQNARTIGGVSFNGTANITVATATGGFTVSGGNLVLGTNSITISGSIGVTGTRVTKGWFTDLESTNAIVGSITGNAATVTTNANLTGPITSSGNATSIASQTGTGTKFVVDTSPTLVTPNIGVATATSVNKVAITAPATSSTITVADGKTFTASNTITLTGTDSVSMNVSNNKLTSVGFTIDGGGSAIAAGKVKGFFTCPYAATITGWNIVADTGTVTVKVWKIATGTAKPTSSNSINTSGVSLSSGTAVHSNTVTDFTSTTVTANDIFAFNIEAGVSGVTEMTFNLELTRT